MKKLTWLAMCVVAAFAVAASAEQGQELRVGGVGQLHAVGARGDNARASETWTRKARWLIRF